jgi:hypothetical protein
MTRRFVAVLLVTLWISPVCLTWGENPQGKLIPVKPAYEEAVQPTQAVRDANTPTPPTPRDQMYVFWVLGRILSYPIDTAESYVSEWIGSWRNRPIAQPASAPAAPNPFTSIRLREIPPAPPAHPNSQ